VFIKRNEEVFYPDPEFKLIAGDTLVVAGESSKINAIVKLVNDDTDVAEQLNAIFNDDEV
jgi:K+/H+ antiporter YhaU regulatory subunit KhtT